MRGAFHHAPRARLAAPDANAADLTPLREVWSGTRVVGLGEATHGTHEFCTLKHRLVAYLVTELGVRVLVLEAGESAAAAVDDYVTHGRGAPARALAGIGFWTWNTSELLALLTWLRSHNARLDFDDRVRFADIDPQLPAAAIDEIEAFLANTAPDELPRVAEALTALRHSGMTRPALAESVRQRVDELAARLDHHTAALPAEERARIRGRATALTRAARLATAPREATAGDSMYAQRDRLMAEAVADLANTVTTPTRRSRAEDPIRKTSRTDPRYWQHSTLPLLDAGATYGGERIPPNPPGDG